MRRQHSTHDDHHPGQHSARLATNLSWLAVACRATMHSRDGESPSEIEDPPPRTGPVHRVGSASIAGHLSESWRRRTTTTIDFGSVARIRRFPTNSLHSNIGWHQVRRAWNRRRHHPQSLPTSRRPRACGCWRIVGFWVRQVPPSKGRRRWKTRWGVVAFR